jgi:hypothetical protein
VRLWTLSKEKVEEEGECEDGTQVRPSFVKKANFFRTFLFDKIFSFPVSRHFAEEIFKFNILCSAQCLCIKSLFSEKIDYQKCLTIVIEHVKNQWSSYLGEGCEGENCG